MPGGAQIGNQNARKAVAKTPEEKREYGRLAMQKRRALLRGDIKQAQQFVGRPRKKMVKGDIFDVAAKLARALAVLLKTPQIDQVATIDGRLALETWHKYWEND